MSLCLARKSINSYKVINTETVRNQNFILSAVPVYFHQDEQNVSLDPTSSNPFKMGIEEYFNPDPESNTRGETNHKETYTGQISCQYY